jgi:hypothetical protein
MLSMNWPHSLDRSIYHRHPWRSILNVRRLRGCVRTSRSACTGTVRFSQWAARDRSSQGPRQWTPRSSTLTAPQSGAHATESHRRERPRRGWVCYPNGSPRLPICFTRSIWPARARATIPSRRTPTGPRAGRVFRSGGHRPNTFQLPDKSRIEISGLLPSLTCFGEPTPRVMNSCRPCQPYRPAR